MGSKGKATRTRLALLREYRKAGRAMKFCDKFKPLRLENRFQELYGVQQALAWALKANAMSPVRCAMMGGVDNPFWKPAREAGPARGKRGKE
jgi:hypothetical protein